MVVIGPIKSSSLTDYKAVYDSAKLLSDTRLSLKGLLHFKVHLI